MKKGYFKLTIFILLLLSCNSNKSSQKNIEANHSIEIDFTDRDRELFITDFVDSVQFISLKFPDNLFLGRPTQVCFWENHIFILDKIQKNIFHFDKSGNFINIINKQGEGPEDYISIKYIMIDKDILFVYDNLSNKINSYTFHGTFINTMKLKEHASSITILPNKNFICFTPDYLYNSPLGLWMMNSNGEYDKHILEYTEKYPVTSSDWNYFYYPANDIIGIACPVTNSYMRYDCRQNELIVDLKINAKQKTVSSFPGIDNNISIKEPYWWSPFFACSDKYLFNIWVESNGKTLSGIFSLYDKTANQIKCYDKLNTKSTGKKHLGIPLMSNLPNSFISYYLDEDEKNSLCIYHLK